MRKLIFALGLMLPLSVSASEDTRAVDQLNDLVGPFIEVVDEEPGMVPYEFQSPFECVPSERPLRTQYSTEIPRDNKEPVNPRSTNSSPFRPSMPGLPGAEIIDTIGQVEVILDKIINIGAKIWKIVEANRPVVNTNFTPANAVPSGTECWMDIERWNRPQSKIFRVSYRAFFGRGYEAVVFKYRVSYTAGGSIDGIGKYLANVMVVPVEVKATTGYNIDATVSVPSVINMGTKYDPVAGMQVLVTWKVSTALKHLERTADFFITGDGEVTHTDAGAEL